MASLLACLYLILAVTFFGSTYVPVKQFKTGDGVFFQWLMCWTIWFWSCIVYFVIGCPQFHAISVLGGVIWATGNMLVVPIIQSIGLGMGMVVWSSTTLFTGWATGVFGLFGVNKNEFSHPHFNYIGVVLSFIALCLNFFIKPNVETTLQPAMCPEYGIIQNQDKVLLSSPPKEESWITRLSPYKRRYLGLGLSIFAGFFFGSSFTPSQYIIDTHFGGHDSALNYVFPFYTGIFLASSGYFIGYVSYLKLRNKVPFMSEDLILPGLCTGSLWAIANTATMIANEDFGLSIVFPIIATVPGAIASCWGIFKFGEIKGRHNFIIVGAIFIFLAIAATLIISSH